MEPQPQQGRRPALAFATFLIFVVLWFQFFAPKSCQRPAESPATTPAATPPVESPPPPPPVSPGETLPFAATRDVALDDAIVVETDLYYARFTNRGAAMTELLLKKYYRTAAQSNDPLAAHDAGAWLPLIAALSPDAPAFRLRRNPTGDAPAALPLDTTTWETSRSSPGDGSGADGVQELRFTLRDGDGHRFDKVFRFRPGRYDFEVELDFSSEREGPTRGTDSYFFLGASGIWDERASPFQSAPAAVVSIERQSDPKVLHAKELEDGAQSFPLGRDEQRPFFGARSNYFAIALAPDAATTGQSLVDSVNCTAAADPFAFARLRELKVKDGKVIDAPLERDLHAQSRSNVLVDAALRIPFPAGGAPPLVIKFDVFAGPKSPESMKGVEHEPFRVLYEMEYGWAVSLRWINRVLLAWMRLMHSLTGNWGVAIILLTITVKVLLFPLNRLQSRTMEQFQKKMKLLQPQLEELKKKHKGNLQKLNVEQQKIMREHGVRPPIFGCLVVFLQMPVWYGLFQIMRSAPELRQAPFCLWITDLSAPDLVPLPFEIPWIGGLHLLPILMVVAWLVQNRMMPKPADPQQAQMQKMMNLFPFIFGVMLYKYASGQSLYMLVNSLLGMLQMKLLKVTPSN